MRRADATTIVALVLAVILAGCGDARVRGASLQRTTNATGTVAPSSAGGGTAKDPPPATPPGANTRTRTRARARAAHPIPPAHPVPAAFRPAPGAPSDSEVRSELAQLGAIQRRQREQELSAAAANLAGLLPWSLEPRSGIQISVASVFRDYGLGLACGGLLGRDQLGVAHKTAPCGTLITFTYAGRSITVPVIDRGPYIAGREWDLTGATAEALGFPGLGRIQWSVAG